MLENACLGRSHRSPEGKARLAEVIERSRALLGLPEDYLVGIIGGSDTAAVEMALWNLLGARGVDVFAWESFSRGWADEIINQLGIEDTRVFEAEYGSLIKASAKLKPTAGRHTRMSALLIGLRICDRATLALCVPGQITIRP